MFEMTFYCTVAPDGSIHVQNAVMGHLGQHHATPEEVTPFLLVLSGVCQSEARRDLSTLSY